MAMHGLSHIFPLPLTERTYPVLTATAHTASLEMFFIRVGSVEVLDRDNKLLTQLGTGEMFGEIGEDTLYSWSLVVVGVGGGGGGLVTAGMWRHEPGSNPTLDGLFFILFFLAFRIRLVILASFFFKIG